MATEVYLPHLGMMQTECLLVKWLRTDGDEVTAGEPIAIIQTDKADVDLEAPAGGRLVGVSLAEGESAAVGTVVAYVVAPGEEEPSHQDGEIDSSIPAVSSERRTEAAAKPELPESADQQPTESSGPKASPVARRLARDLGIDLSAVAATGPGGRITETDVRTAAAATETGDLGLERPQSRARQVMAQRMALSFHTVPHLYLETTVDASHLVSASGNGVSVTDLILYVVARCLRTHPELNATFHENKVIEFSRVNLGVAVDTPDGLYVPVIADADVLGVHELSTARMKIVERARTGALLANDLSDATFTVTNLGVFDVDAAWPIVNAPGVAILAVGRIRNEPVVLGEEIAVRPRVRLVLAADHRAVDGAQGARFLGTTKATLETLSSNGNEVA